MAPFSRVVGITLVFLVLIAFFVWVLIEMASYSHGDTRLAKLAIGFGLSTLGVAVVYALTTPLGRKHKRR